ncbi:Fe-S protein assembly co-chaperone HscB [Orbaceae bacterium ac157xtp]
MSTLDKFENYFKLLNIPEWLPIDQSILNQHYKLLQKQYHPDNFALADEKQKAEAMIKSITINTAYQVLKDPIKTAEHLLALNGINIDDEQKNAIDNTFLMQQFMYHEQIDEIEQTQDSQALEQLNEQVLAQKQALTEQLIENANSKNWHSLLHVIYQLRYINRLIDKIELLEETII